MSRVAIIGSCITRDLWPIQGEGAADLLYVSRTSLPSLFAAPVAGFAPNSTDPDGLRPAQHRTVVNDLTKRWLEKLVAYRPTHLIFDFIDERFDLLAVGEALATHSWELETAGYLAQPAFVGRRQIPRLSDACDQLWASGLEELAQFLAATPLSEARLILHDAQWADSHRRAGRHQPLDDVQLWDGRPADAQAHNALLRRYQDQFRDLLPATDVAAPDWRIADENHRWGLSPFHYVPEYYAEIWRQLRELDV